MMWVAVAPSASVIVNVTVDDPTSAASAFTVSSADPFPVIANTGVEAKTSLLETVGGFWTDH
jgi:hypothetical protein